MKLHQKTAEELSKMLQEKKCSAVELLQEMQPDTADAFLCRNPAAAAEAEKSDFSRSGGGKLHPLSGIPVAVKDNISTKGMPTTCASRMLEHYLPPFDATVVEKLCDAGIVLAGKTNMDEFAMGSSTEYSAFFRTKNPWNPSFVPGGSSGGSAAAVASGQVPLALGSDTGGSVRQPAAFCGIVGLKPTYGSVSRYGLVAFASSLDQIGMMGKTVADTAMLFRTVCGHDRRDATSWKGNYPEILPDVQNNSLHGITIGLPKELFGSEISDNVKEAVMQAAAVLERAGAVLREVSIPCLRYAVNAYYILSSAEASSNLARFDGVRYGFRAEGGGGLREMYSRTRSQGFGKEVKRRILLGTFVLSEGYYAAYYQKAEQVRRQIAHTMKLQFRECSLLLSPVTPGTAFRFDEYSDPVMRYSSDLCTVPANLSGIPAISIPCGISAEGMPIGMQLMGDAFTEPLLFRAGQLYETIRGRFPMAGEQNGI